MSENALDGFKIVQVKFKEENKHCHQIFFKAHNVRVLEPSKPSDRTLFCANIPPWMDKDAVKRIFMVNGVVEAVYLEFEPSVGAPTPPSNPFFPTPSDPYSTGNGFKFAYVVFERASSIRNSMTLMDLDKVHVVSSKERPVVTGVKKWIKQYNNKVVNVKELLADVQEHMADFDRLTAVAKEAEEAMNEADDEGWVTVTKSSKIQAGKAKKAAEKEKEEIEVRGKKNRRKKRKVVELKNFYSHQMKSEKIQQIQSLRAKFEEDKLKIAKMKADRKFRPF